MRKQVTLGYVEEGAMPRRLEIAGLVLAAVVIVAGAVACGSSKKSNVATTATTEKTAAVTSGSTPGGTTAGGIGVELIEWKIVPTKSSVPAGSITFNVRNIGGATHEMVVLKTDLPATGLPTKADGSADEQAAGISSVGETGDMEQGTSKSLTVDLQPGNYVLICNIVQTTNGAATLAKPLSHYAQGMTIAFTVTQ